MLYRSSFFIANLDLHDFVKFHATLIPILGISVFCHFTLDIFFILFYYYYFVFENQGWLIVLFSLKYLFLFNSWKNLTTTILFFFIIPKLTILNRAIGAYDVSINIAFCGVCYADVAWTRNKMGTSKYPLVPGYVDLFDYAIVILVTNYVEDIVSPPHMPPFYFIFSNWSVDSYV